MLYKTLSAAVYGIDANLIEVEVDVAPLQNATKTSSPPSVCPTQRYGRAASAFALP